MTLPAGNPRTGRVERIIEELRVLERERKITEDAALRAPRRHVAEFVKRVEAGLTRAGLPLRTTGPTAASLAGVRLGRALRDRRADAGAAHAGATDGRRARQAGDEALGAC